MVRHFRPWTEVSRHCRGSAIQASGFLFLRRFLCIQRLLFLYRFHPTAESDFLSTTRNNINVTSLNFFRSYSHLSSRLAGTNAKSPILRSYSLLSHQQGHVHSAKPKIRQIMGFPKPSDSSPLKHFFDVVTIYCRLDAFWVSLVTITAASLTLLSSRRH